MRTLALVLSVGILTPVVAQSSDPRPASAPVTHAHDDGGSCAGVLTITERGYNYQATRALSTDGTVHPHSMPLVLITAYTFRESENAGADFLATFTYTLPGDHTKKPYPVPFRFQSGQDFKRLRAAADLTFNRR
jgi:hypothetical protein